MNLVKNNLPLLLLGFFFCFLGGCFPSRSYDEPRVHVSSEDTLDDRVTLVETEVPVEGESGEVTLEDEEEDGDESLSSLSSHLSSKAATRREVTLVHVATVAAPENNGETLGANDVVIKGNFAYVTYNTAGDTFAGGVQVINLQNRSDPELISQFIFDDTDVNAATADGSDLYLGESVNTDDSDFLDYDLPSAFEHVRLTGQQKYQSTDGPIDMPSYAVNDLEVTNNKLFMTVGAADGGLVVYDLNNSSVESFISFEDARSVALSSGEDDAVVFAGTPGRVMVVDTSTLDTSEFSTGGATIEFAKSTIELLDNFAFIGAGDGGMIVANWSTGEVLKTIDNPEVAGLDSSLTVTNAVTLYKDRYAFISNGEAGIRVADIEEFVDGSSSEIPILGTLIFGVEESANAIKISGRWLLVAAGTGGLKIVYFDYK